ncbi:hypothetical protein LRS10_11735 [Phenylobacterium sp. J426]|uniref:hypothetical protein n=1 Tax=Phenylobacterium sp. J426 TaxID=2898439 RepID=UPI0021518C56|nr:hypothetical protein [Phenylobacterium sp. J426]MCR5874778.1 hypothetical protein [Phenylobacterium sp. J426]
MKRPPLRADHLAELSLLAPVRFGRVHHRLDAAREVAGLQVRVAELEGVRQREVFREGGRARSVEEHRGSAGGGFPRQPVLAREMAEVDIDPRLREDLLQLALAEALEAHAAELRIVGEEPIARVAALGGIVGADAFGRRRRGRRLGEQRRGVVAQLANVGRPVPMQEVARVGALVEVDEVGTAEQLTREGFLPQFRNQDVGVVDGEPPDRHLAPRKRPMKMRHRLGQDDQAVVVPLQAFGMPGRILGVELHDLRRPRRDILDVVVGHAVPVLRVGVDHPALEADFAGDLGKLMQRLGSAAGPDRTHHGDSLDTGEVHRSFPKAPAPVSDLPMSVKLMRLRPR